MPSARDSGDPESPDWFSNRQRTVSFDRPGLLRFATELRERLAGGREFAVRIASDRTLRNANRQFLDQDHATDVLSFPSGGDLYLGDILISATHARQQARRLGHSVDQELRILLLHGLLHLLGHDHETDGGRMRRLERTWRRRLRLPAGLIERDRS